MRTSSDPRVESQRPTYWASPLERVILRKDEVHVWRASLDAELPRLEGHLNVLSSDERERADRFRFPRDRRHFIAARGLLRAILARYLKMRPGDLRFQYRPAGKPALFGGSGAEPLSFNLSHSHGLALYAIACGRQVGVDLERIRPDISHDRIARRFFSTREIAALTALPGEQRNRMFFYLWTSKEAFIKATGEGLALLLNEFDALPLPGESRVLLTIHKNATEGARWALRKLDVGRHYASALAVEGSGWRLRCWDWDG